MAPENFPSPCVGKTLSRTSAGTVPVTFFAWTPFTVSEPSSLKLLEAFDDLGQTLFAVEDDRRVVDLGRLTDRRVLESPSFLMYS